MIMTSPDDLTWQDDALCVDLGPRKWDAAPALIRRRYCRVCPVQKECREFMDGRFQGEWKPKGGRR